MEARVGCSFSPSRVLAIASTSPAERGGKSHPGSGRRVTPKLQATAKRAECNRREVMEIGNIREKNCSSEGVSAKEETLTKGLQSPVHRFDSGCRLQRKASKIWGFWDYRLAVGWQ